MSQPGRRDDGEAQKEAWPVPSSMKNTGLIERNKFLKKGRRSVPPPRETGNKAPKVKCSWSSRQHTDLTWFSAEILWIWLKNFLVTVLIYRNQKLFIKTYCLWKKHVVKMIYQCIISRAIIMTVNLLPLLIVNPLPKLCSLKHAKYLQWRVPGCSPNNNDSCRGRHAPV